MRDAGHRDVAVPEDDRPWERPGAVRRDCAPHRGNWLRLLATAVLACSGLLGMCGAAALAVPLGLVLWDQAGHDLAKIEAGLMDLEGRRATAEARDRALAAVVVSLIGLAFLAATLFAQRL